MISKEMNKLASRVMTVVLTLDLLMISIYIRTGVAGLVYEISGSGAYEDVTNVVC